MADRLQTPSLSEILHRIVRCARTGDYGTAASELNVALQSIQPLLASRSADVSWVRKIAYSLETLYLMQQNADWVAIADIVEYELAPLIAKRPE